MAIKTSELKAFFAQISDDAVVVVDDVSKGSSYTAPPIDEIQEGWTTDPDGFISQRYVIIAKQ
jgi:hypothetical protein